MPPSTSVLGSMRPVCLTEPSAVAPDATFNFSIRQYAAARLSEDDSHIRRYRARFCNGLGSDRILLALHTTLKCSNILISLSSIEHPVGFARGSDFVLPRTHQYRSSSDIKLRQIISFATGK